MKKIIFFLAFLSFNICVSAKAPSIGTSKAVAYEVSELELLKSGDLDYVFVCATSAAQSKDQRAQTMAKVAISLEADYPNLRVQVLLSSHKDLCQAGRLIGETFYSPNGEGWTGLSGKKWTWQILTTGRSVTQHEITDTLVYEKNRSRFKKQFGVMDYHEYLNKYVEKKVGHTPHYVTTGLWVDGFHNE